MGLAGVGRITAVLGELVGKGLFACTVQTEPPRSTLESARPDAHTDTPYETHATQHEVKQTERAQSRVCEYTPRPYGSRHVVRDHRSPIPSALSTPKTNKHTIHRSKFYPGAGGHRSHGGGAK